MTWYLDRLLTHLPKELSECKDVLDDLLNKVKIIDSKYHTKLLKSIKSTGNKPVYIYNQNGTIWHRMFNPSFPEVINYMEFTDLKLTEGKYYVVDYDVNTRIYYTYPTWSESKNVYEMESFTNPSEDELRFLVPFEVGEQKIHLYGSLVVMSYQSELIKRLLDKLDTKEFNVLAPEMKVNEPSLLTLWSKMNGKDETWETTKDVVETWPPSE